MIKRNDFILIGAVIMICLAVFFMIHVTKKEGSRLVVTVDGKPVGTFRLDRDTSYTVKGSDGSYNTFVIKDGYASMVKASCPDKLCVKEKKIHYNHETIVCLPNKVVLEVAGGEEDNVDMIAN